MSLNYHLCYFSRTNPCYNPLSVTMSVKLLLQSNNDKWCILMTAFHSLSSHLAHGYEWIDRTGYCTCCLNCYCFPSCSGQTGTKSAWVWLMFLLKQPSHLFKFIIHIHDPPSGNCLGVAGNSMQCAKCSPQSHESEITCNRKPKQLVFTWFHAFM